jgi:hypothetical protein
VPKCNTCLLLFIINRQSETGTGIPKDRDEVNRREVSECDG